MLSLLIIDWATLAHLRPKLLSRPRADSPARFSPLPFSRLSLNSIICMFLVLSNSQHLIAKANIQQ